MGPYPQQLRFWVRTTQRLPPRHNAPTLLHCPHDLDASIIAHTHNSTQLTDTSVPTLQLFFATFTAINYCHQLSSSIILHHSSFSYTPFHVTDDPIQFCFFQLFLQLLPLLHPIHVSVHFYFSIFTTQFPILSLTQHGFEKIPSFLLSSFFILLFLLYPKFRSIRSVQLGVPIFSSSSLSLYSCCLRLPSS